MPSNSFHIRVPVMPKIIQFCRMSFFQIDHPSSSVAAVENYRWHFGIIQNNKFEVESGSRKHNAKWHSSTTLKLTFFYQQEKAKVIKNRWTCISFIFNLIFFVLCCRLHILFLFYKLINITFVSQRDNFGNLFKF